MKTYSQNAGILVANNSEISLISSVFYPEVKNNNSERTKIDDVSVLFHHTGATLFCVCGTRNQLKTLFLRYWYL